MDPRNKIYSRQLAVVYAMVRSCFVSRRFYVKPDLLANAIKLVFFLTQPLLVLLQRLSDSAHRQIIGPQVESTPALGRAFQH